MAEAKQRISIRWRGRFSIWFAALFAVFRYPSQHETGEIAAATDPGAPVAPWLVGKAIWTTLISGVVLAALVAFADYACIY
jgi:predicted secreted protein